MKVCYQLDNSKNVIECPDLRDKYGHPDHLAIRRHLKNQGINHRGRIRVAA